jgi:formamidopyrimidine-DNA glycosylase
VSIEAPEAYILAAQMHRQLVGKTVASVQMQNCESMQRIGCVNSDLSAFNQLCGRTVSEVSSRGLVVLVRLGGVNLLLAPEYSGKSLYHKTEAETPKKFHAKITFSDDSAFSVALTGLGCIQVYSDAELKYSYVYRRDFSTTPSPLNEQEFTFPKFAAALAAKNVNIKAALVGKDAVVVGLSNSSFQDILFQAQISPKRKASSLSEQEKRQLYNAITSIMAERVKQGGKTQFVDFYGVLGRYVPLMGPNMKGQLCSRCGTAIEAASLGGGQVYFCPKCQT